MTLELDTTSLTQARLARGLTLEDAERGTHIARRFLIALEEHDYSVFPAPIVTQVSPLGTFWPAEEYHQGYYRKNPGQGYCQAVIGPKVAKLREKYAARLRKSAAP